MNRIFIKDTVYFLFLVIVAFGTYRTEGIMKYYKTILGKRPPSHFKIEKNNKTGKIAYFTGKVA